MAYKERFINKKLFFVNELSFMVDRVDIVFVLNPQIWFERMYPVGILILSSYLKDKGFDNVILDSKLSKKQISSSECEKLILEKVLKIKPKIVCFSSTHIEFEEVVRINNAIRKKDKNIITIVGGPQPTYRFKDFLDNGFDFVCIGEGEKTLHEFVKEVMNKTYNWKQIKGLAWKDKGLNIVNEPRELLTEEELNKLPMPSFDKVDKKYFDISGGIVRGLPLKGALLLTTRGCPFSCSFCGCNLIFGRKLRFKSLEKIDEEVRYLKDNFDIEGIWIVDDTFTIKKGHLEGVAKILKKHNIIWGCQSRVNTINEEMIQIMKEAGCIQIDFGVESGSQRILDEIIHKGITINQVINAFMLARKYGIRTLANFMIGLPTETHGDLNATIDLAEKINADDYVFSIATPLPGTELYDMVDEDISPSEYASIDWNISCLTEKLNKSKIKNLTAVYRKIRKRFLHKSLLKSMFSFYNLMFFLKRGYKLERIKFVVGYIIRFMKSSLSSNR